MRELRDPIVLSGHPIVQCSLARLRDKTTGTAAFREHLERIGLVLAAHATSGLQTREINVHTPLAVAPGHALFDRPALVPVLRAGEALLPGFRTMLPEAPIWHLGMSRDEHTLASSVYVNKIPTFTERDQNVVYVLDVMLATGGSATQAIEIAKNRAADQVVFVGVLAAPEGVARLRKDHPDVPLVLAAIDLRLNERGYIVPGLGDAGDRYFGTSPPN